MSGETPTYKCLLCGVDHPIIGGRVEHIIFRARESGVHDWPAERFVAARTAWSLRAETDGVALLITSLCDEVLLLRAKCDRLALENVTVAARPTADEPEPVEPSDDIDGFMAAVSEWVALTAYRLAHEPLSRSVPPDELEAYSRAKRHLRAALSYFEDV